MSGEIPGWVTVSADFRSDSSVRLISLLDWLLLCDSFPPVWSKLCCLIQYWVGAIGCEVRGKVDASRSSVVVAASLCVCSVSSCPLPAYHSVAGLMYSKNVWHRCASPCGASSGELGATAEVVFGGRRGGSGVVRAD